MITSDAYAYLRITHVDGITIDKINRRKEIGVVHNIINGLQVFMGYTDIVVILVSGTRKRLKYAEYKRLENRQINKRENPSISARIRSLVSLFRNKH